MHPMLMTGELRFGQSYAITSIMLPTSPSRWQAPGELCGWRLHATASLLSPVGCGCPGAPRSPPQDALPGGASRVPSLCPCCRPSSKAVPAHFCLVQLQLLLAKIYGQKQTSLSADFSPQNTQLLYLGWRSRVVCCSRQTFQVPIFQPWLNTTWNPPA